VSQNEDDLQAAFELISDYKAGNLKPGSEVSEKQFHLLKLLRADLLPSEPELDEELPALVSRVAKEDSRWNREAMSAINDIYALRESEKHNEADSLQKSFLQRCPSSWYREIVDAV
jgi:hypothetical protein